MRSILGRLVLATAAVALIGGCTGGAEPSTVAGDPSQSSSSNPGSSVPAPTPELGAELGSPGDYVWHQVPIGAGGWVTGITLHPTDASSRWIRTDVGGLYSHDGTQWVQAITLSSVAVEDPDPGWYAVESVAVAPSDSQRVYALVGDADSLPAEGDEPTGRILRSGDGGETWTPSETATVVAGNRDHRQRSERLAVDPENPDHVLVGTRLDGLMRSTDGGATFERVAGLPDAAVIDPDQSFQTPGVTFVTFASAAEVYVGISGVGVLRSDDGGTTFAEVIPAGGPDRVPFEGAVTGNYLAVALDVAGSEEGGRLVLYDRDTGESRDIAPNDRSPTWTIAIDPTDSSRIVAADRAVRNGSIFRSVDGGSSWRSADVSITADDVPWLASTDLDGWMSIGRLAFDPHDPDRLWFAEGMGVWYADDLFDDLDAVINWNSQSAGIEETVGADLIVTDGNRLSAVADRQGFRHDDLAAYPASTLIDRTFVGGTDLDSAGQVPGAAVWIGAEYHRYWNEDRGGRGAMTLDGGATWSELPNLSNDHFGGNIAMSATDPNNLVWVPSYFINPWEYDGQPRGVFTTTDGGEKWIEHKPLAGSARFHRLVWWLGRRAVAADRVTGGVFYLNDDEERFLVSTDGGVNWESAAFAPPCKEANACLVFGQLRAHPDRAGQVWASVGTDGLYRTDDQGQSEWVKLPGVVEARQFDFGAPTVEGGPWAIYLLGIVDGDESLGLYRSDDDGVSWERITQYPGGIFRPINVVTADPDVPGRVYVGFNGLGFVRGDWGR